MTHLNNNNLFYALLFVILSCSTFQVQAQKAPTLNNSNIQGYRGIWFTLGQFYEYGDKYSGGLGTYTAKHKPLAIYAPEVNKTFFVYGGTLNKKSTHLLCMIGSFDHATQQVSVPTIVYDKMGVDDPHDDPSLLIDPDGYLWVFVSGRGTKRPGFKYRSRQPYNIAEFEQITEEEMTYPQAWYVEGKGFFHFFTKYTGIRELYYESSTDGRNWTEDQKLAGIIGQPGEKAGHYQVSGAHEGTVATFFSRHPDGNVDKRTNLYYLQSRDFGKSWETIDGHPLELPITQVYAPPLVRDYGTEGKNVYLKDLAFDENGRPVCLYITSGGHEPGPDNAPREWRVTHWTGRSWQTTTITTSDHNYDMGSLWINGKYWTVIAPTKDGPQLHGGGGEIQKWESMDNGESWKKSGTLTQNSKFNHNYVRKVVNGQPPFQFFWADGNPDKMSKSQLYFGNMEGQVWQLPYRMKGKPAQPKLLKK